MIKVTIELVPHGDESKAGTISTISIANTTEDLGENKYIYEYLALVKDKSEMKEIRGFVLHDRGDVGFHLLEDVIRDITRKALGLVK
jgi:hypothetical protein